MVVVVVVVVVVVGSGGQWWAVVSWCDADEKRIPKAKQTSSNYTKPKRPK